MRPKASRRVTTTHTRRADAARQRLNARASPATSVQLVEKIIAIIRNRDVQFRHPADVAAAVDRARDVALVFVFVTPVHGAIYSLYYGKHNHAPAALVEGVLLEEVRFPGGNPLVFSDVVLVLTSCY